MLLLLSTDVQYNSGKLLSPNLSTMPPTPFAALADNNTKHTERARIDCYSIIGPHIVGVDSPDGLLPAL